MEIPKINIPGQNQTFQNILSKDIDKPNKITKFFKDYVSPAVNTIGTVATQLLDISPEYKDLLTLQMKVQQEMQTLSMESNIEKSKHETQMSAIRNIRVG